MRVYSACFFAWAWLFCLFSPAAAKATSSALIVVGLSGSSANAEEFDRLANETRRLLIERGFAGENVHVLTQKVTRDAVLQKLEQLSKQSHPEDDFWLVLFGHSGKSQGGSPAFQVSGPRLTAGDLKTRLDALAGRQFVLIGTNESGPFLPLLQDPRRTIVAATKSEGESDQPRFPAMWVAAFAESPKGSLSSIAARAAELVAHEYESSQLAQTEHARMADPTSGKILEPPFGVNLVARSEPDARLRPVLPLLSASDIKVPIKNADAEWERQPATDETKKLIAEAAALPNPEGHSALMLEQRIGFTVEDDRTADRFTFYRVFLAREDSVEAWANHFLPQAPPMVTSKLEVARVIRPDGSTVVFNPAKLPGATDPTSGSVEPMTMVYLPDAHVGCLIEIGFRTRQLLEPTLPQVSEAFPIQRDIPVLATTLEVRVPQKQNFRVLLNNSPSAAEESVVNGRRVYQWHLPALPAFEHLGGDPPWTSFVTWVGISSLASWDDFAEWFRRLAKGSDVIDPSVSKVAVELAAGSKTRLDQIQRCFEFVSALRYMAVEIGVQGFRPRTPATVLANRFGDCKDKANLLVALLGCQGIEAHLVLLNRGGATDVNFPSWQFNHAICYVPKADAKGQPEDLWLDATDSVTPFGFVAPGDQSRAGLIITKEKAEFKTITSAKEQISAVTDDWALTQSPERGWSGTFRRQVTGLAEDGMRRIFRGLTPMQRQARVYQIASELLPAGDFADARVSDVASLGEAVGLTARLENSGPRLPEVNLPWFEAFAAPARDRPLLLNDGQPLAGAQMLRLTFANGAPAKLPEPFSVASAAEKLTVQWRWVDTKTAERVARVEFKQPMISSEEYQRVRRALLAWKTALAQSPEQISTP
ncbi:MAG: hypothetical protein QOD99_2814 [Chthoniobacter sp.]|jgi:hypothetical protein|nr:hypothetical protein [Chthoniobacter sp.]